MVEVVGSCSSFLFALVFSWNRNGHAVSIAMMVVVRRVAFVVVIALHDVASMNFTKQKEAIRKCSKINNL